MLALLHSPAPAPTDVGWSWPRSARIAGHAGAVMASVAKTHPDLRVSPSACAALTTLPFAHDAHVDTPAGLATVRFFPDNTACAWVGGQMLPHPITLERPTRGASLAHASLARSIAFHLPTWSGRIASTTADLAQGAQGAFWGPVVASDAPEEQAHLQALKAILHNLIASMVGGHILAAPVHPWSPKKFTITLYGAIITAKGDLLPPSLDLHGLNPGDLMHTIKPSSLLFWADGVSRGLLQHAQEMGNAHLLIGQIHQEMNDPRASRAHGIVADKILTFDLDRGACAAISSHTIMTAYADSTRMGLPILGPS